MHHFYPRSTTRFSQSLAVIVDFCRAKRSRPGGLWLLAFLLFLSNRGLAQDWNQIIKTAASDRRTLTSLGRATNDQFGYSVAIDGDYAVVGANGESEDAGGMNTLSSAGSAIVFKRVNGTWTQIKKLVASDRAAADYFGYSVAISGSLIVVGANLENDGTLSNMGAAYVFSQNQGGADNWGQVKKLVSSDRSTFDFFGTSVAVSGSTIIVGAIGESLDAAGANNMNGTGAVYMFSQDQGGTNNWGQVKKLVASDRSPNARFGWSVAISGNTIVVGANLEDKDASGSNPLTDAGSAYVFSQNQGGVNNWGQVKKIVATDRAAADFFGYSVAISGSLIVVGAPQNDLNSTSGNPGSAYVFSQNQGGADNWGQVKKIVASDRAANDYFGTSVSISGNTIVVGANKNDLDASGSNTLTDAGSAYVFSQNQGGAENWGQVKKIVASDRAANDYFGYSVAISGSRIMVGAYQEDEDESGNYSRTSAGSAYVFNQNQGGTDNWGQEQKVVLSDYFGSQYYGFSVAIDGAYAVVGAYQDYTDASSGQSVLNAGSAYVLKRQNGTWTQIKKLVASDRVSNSYFGYSVAISGNTIVVGASQNSQDAAGLNMLLASGAAYVFSQNQGGTDNWGEVKKLVASDRSILALFGTSVGISGSTIVVGAMWDSRDASGGNSLTNAGSAYVFSQDQGGTNNWGQVKKLVASDRGTNSYFGFSVTINGNIIGVGAYGESKDASGENTLTLAGSVYLFSQNQGGADNWGQVKKLVANDRVASSWFGNSVAINGSTLVVGASQNSQDAAGGNTLTNAGSAYVFSQNQGGTDNWGQVKKIVASDRAANDNFGNSVSISGNTIVVGAVAGSGDASGGNTLPNAGTAYVFSQNQGGSDNWGQVQKLVASDRGTGDKFGQSVGISGGQIVVGASLDDEDAAGANSLSNTGSAYFFASSGVTLTGFSANPATACAGTVTSFSASIGNLTGSYSFTLTNGTSSTSGTGSTPTLTQSLTATGSGTQIFTLIVSINGSPITATTSLLVNAAPVASILKPASSTLTCTTTSLSLTATGGSTYLWEDASTNAVRTLTTAGTYSVKVTDANSCTAAATTTITSNTVLSLSVGSNLPQANVGVVVSLTASGATTYQWTAPSTVVLTSPSTASALSVSLTTAGEQRFTVVGTSGVCSQTSVVSVTALAGPDLSAIITMPSGNFSSEETKGLLMQLQEVNGSTASGAVVVTITVPTGYSVSFDNTLTSIQVSGGSLVSVANGKWTLSGSVGSQQLRISLNGGESIGGHSTMDVGFWVSRTSANGGSRSNITISVADDSSGSYDVNRLNNIYARVITAQ
ncbi:FG-GAP repeat protein [Spirosoma sp. 48-14]|uniref:beta strand repeat-containing protein n=1 Tax=Spirosoma sp. 48-14 TaxID=1895854 RepID=UPI00096519E0|nr:FG-GAP repeat protein [Spirosoma sp. 48-14]OJW71238.1 MAG: hypothetical protein BGO59_04180 [Spirosoma sp. 48-14]